MDPTIAKFIEDLVKGASETEGLARGSRVRVEVQSDGVRCEKLADAADAIPSAVDLGASEAASRFGVKRAFLGALLPLAGSLLGPAAARWGLGRLAAGAGGQALKGVAGKIMPHIGGRIGGGIFDAAAGMLGGGLGARMTNQQASPMTSGVGGLLGGQMIRPQVQEGPWQ